MSGECEECGEHTVDCVCDDESITTISELPEELMKKISNTRICVECGKFHNTGIENKTEGTFQPIDKCIDCLMSKCSFNFQDTQITLDDVAQKTSEEMHRELGESLVKILQNTYWNPTNEICDLPKSEHGQAS